MAAGAASMSRMLVRCGRCRTELEVSGPGEFLCPRCGTRNVIRGAPAQPQPGYGVPDLTVPGGMPPRPGPPPADDPSIRWIACPECSWRFAIGSAESVICPNCRRNLTVDETGPRVVAEP